MSDQRNSDNGSATDGKGSITLRWWQLVAGAVAVIALSVGVTITVDMVLRDNATRAESAAEYRKPEKADTEQDAAPKKSVRGNLIKHIGDTAGIYKGANDKSLVAQWTVNGITLDAPCTPAYEGAPTQPANGHFVLLDISAETSSDFDEFRYSSLALGWGGFWTYVDKDGTQWNGNPSSTAAINCLPQNDRLPSTISTGIKAHGEVLLDLPSTDGYLVYSDGGNGWEYPLS